MERKIGEVFEYEGKKLKVVETANNLCFDCYFFDGVNCQRTEREGGECSDSKRADYKPVIFVEVDKEQQQDEHPQELNLCEILKDCPKGTELYSLVHGKVLFSEINNSKVCPIEVIAYGYDNKEFTASFTADGRFLHFCIAECVLFPSKDQRDWDKFKAPWLNKPKFDPKTLKPFDRVLVRCESIFNWNCSLFSNIDDQCENYPFGCLGSYYRFCIPYNEDTKHLVGTSGEAPEYYRYWED